MDIFIEHAAMVLPVLGCDLFRKRSQLSSERTAEPVSGVDSSLPLFTFSTGGAAANARETEDGFIVLGGSTARRTPSETFPAGYRSLRDKLMAAGQLIAGPSPDLLRFAGDVTFTSPSAAASIVAARSASGPIEWKVSGTGLSYRDWRAARLDAGP